MGGECSVPRRGKPLAEAQTEQAVDETAAAQGDDPNVGRNDSRGELDSQVAKRRMETGSDRSRRRAGEKPSCGRSE